MTARPTNWAGNITFSAAHLHQPTSIAQLQQLVGSTEHVRAVGTAHSFNRIADTSFDQVSAAALPQSIDVDTAAGRVAVAGGLRYGEVGRALQAQGFALRNTGSLPHIGVAGAVATGTHGSGVRNQNLSAAVSAMTLVTATGDLVDIARTDPDFTGMVVALGALGIVVRLELDIVPTFDVRQFVYDDLPRESLDEHLAEILASAYSVSLFTDWSGPTINQVWVKQRVDDAWDPPAQWFGATLADEPRHPIPGMPALNCTQQLGVPGPWNERLPHFRLEFMPSSGAELQSEYLLPAADALAAIAAIESLREYVAPVVQISEIRTVAADDLWLSAAYARYCVALHFTWVPDTAAVTPVAARVEEALAPFGARPHWGKVFTMGGSSLRGLYPRFSDFERLMSTYDPTGKFRNDYLGDLLDD